ncbi:MAG: hypothetical protein ACYTG7_07950, partial [Planctomycetota bacterium]
MALHEEDSGLQVIMNRITSLVSILLVFVVGMVVCLWLFPSRTDEPAFDIKSNNPKSAETDTIRVSTAEDSIEESLREPLKPAVADAVSDIESKLV